MKSMQSTQPEKSSKRLQSIDALRGIAALGVVLYHGVGPHPTIQHGFFNYLVVPFQFLFAQGYVGVFLFFVISGFCIHLQWAKARATSTPYEITFKAFWKRRLRRLYPPYLFALALFLGMMAFTSGIDLTHFFIYDIVMHLLMLHNLDPQTCYSINGVFWTLAIEEQLYLAYFALLFMRVRWGWRTALIVCVSARVGWFFLAYFAYRLYNVGIPVGEAAASHWLTWALGAISVEAAVGLIKIPRWCRDIRVGVTALATAVTLSYLLPEVNQGGVLHTLGSLALHPVWGIGFFVLVNYVVKAEEGWRARFKTPEFIRALAYVGIFSYSLYLTHQLVVMVSWRFVVNGWPSVVNSLLIIAPVCVAFAWVFFLFCERPFMKAPARVIPLDSDKVRPLEETASA